MKNSCRLCLREDLLSSYYYPDIHFNNKVFKYYKCNNCKSINVFPSPNHDDLELMYGDEDHTYLKHISGKLIYNYPFANHQGYQIKFLKNLKNDLSNKTLLDYGCGSGFYMNYANKYGAKSVGIEFDEDFVNLLKSKTNLDIYSFDSFKEKFNGKHFDFIHIGHVLEHINEPVKLMEELKTFANKNTRFIIDGPLEKNICLSRLFIDLGSKIKAKKYNEFSPQHLICTTYKSQLDFFNNLNLKQEKYIIAEQYFPLPSTLSKSIVSIFSFFIASFSILISKVIPKYGNIFHYIGKLK